MIQKIKNKLLILASLLMLAVPVAVPAVAFAQCDATNGDCIQGGLCKGAQTLDVSAGGTTSQCTSDTTSSTGVSNLLKKIINIFSVIIGVIAVLMIIYGGFKYITSSGNAEGTKSARNTILYAIVGLVVVALAQLIVRFVLNSATGIGQ